MCGRAGRVPAALQPQTLHARMKPGFAETAVCPDLRRGIQKDFHLGVGKNFRANVPAFHHNAAARANLALRRHHPFPYRRMD